MSTAVLNESLHVGSRSTTSSVSGFVGTALVHLFGEVVPGWRMENPLPLHVESDGDGRFIASDEVFDVYGTGGSWDAAVRDYKLALVEYFEIIGAAQDEQSKLRLAHLRTYLRRG
jgi:hypothetical protein